MAVIDEITILPSDIEKILQQLKSISWNQGPVIIRDRGDEYIIRDKEENHIFTLKQTHEEPG